ncbi:MAG: anthranilate phosphoribosyltransferase [Phycisphaeraceae bacterium]|nr:anthranilate phosphoribosyltransferase [Phycisphaeraceae bacterium]
MKHLLTELMAGNTLSQQQAEEAFELIMTGQASQPQIAALLTLLQFRGPTVDELTGAARIMRRHVVPVVVPPGLRVIDTCGTGGDHGGTFNISTAAALVAAAAGRPLGVAVAKHGNRSVTSSSGSSQVLECLGVTLTVPPETLTRCLDVAGICFCFAPNHHPAMKHAMPVRQALGFRTVFNILGPLTNPAGATRQVVGVFAPELAETIAHVLARLGTEHAMVVHGQGLDELTTWGMSHITIVRHGEVETCSWPASSLDLAPGNLQALKADSPGDSARIVREVLAGVPGPARDIVALNAAAALVVADIAPDLAHGFHLAAQAIDQGHARDTLDQLIALTAGA